MNPWINYHHLYYFKTIAEEGSVSAAAVRLRIGQPTLSIQLKLFEESLGVKLFDRKNKRLILTEQGTIALDYAKNIFKTGSEMYEVLHDRIRPMKTALHLGAQDSIPKQVIVRLVGAALKTAPCQITLSEGRADELFRELSSHKMDLVISNFVPNGASAAGLTPRLLAKNPVSFYGSARYRKLKKDFPQSLSGQPMIFPTYDSRLRQDLDHWGKLNKIELNIGVESQDIATKKLMATKGMGVIPAAAHAVTDQVKRGELFELGKVVGVDEDLFLVRAQRKIRNPIAERLFEIESRILRLT